MFTTDMDFSEKMKPYIYNIIRNLKFSFKPDSVIDAPQELDEKYGVDSFAIILPQKQTIALRVKRFNLKYKDNIIIRTYRPDRFDSCKMAGRTELQKLQDGSYRAKYYFQCMSNKNQDGLLNWFLFDIGKMISDGFFKDKPSSPYKKYRFISPIITTYTGEQIQANSFISIPVEDIKDYVLYSDSNF